jgi:hypothetical protein
VTGEGRPRAFRPSDTTEPEVPLPGGLANRGQVVRVGETVRRPQRRTSPAAHALLRHLESVGFDGAPRFLGVDEQGREVLSYIPGDTAVAPYPDWVLTDEALGSVAALVRAYHRAVAGFDPTPHTWPAALPHAFAGEIVSHNDLNLDNVVFRDGRAVALLDFDLAGPGSRLWDVACAARLWAPLRPDETVHDSRRGRGFERLRLFVEGYGLDATDRARLPVAIGENQAWFGRLIGRYVAAGHHAFTDYARSTGRLPADRYQRWLADHDDAVRSALGN